MTDDELQAFIEERNAVLIRGDIEELKAFFAKHHPGFPPFPDGHTAEIALHKARTGALGIPIEIRLASKRWLTDHGYSSFDDGELSEH